MENEVNSLDDLLEKIEETGEQPAEITVAASEATPVVAATPAPVVPDEKAAAYAEQESNVGIASMEAPVVTSTAGGSKSTRKSKKASASTGTPATTPTKRRSTADMKASEAIVYKISDKPENFAFSASQSLEPADLVKHRDEFLASADKLADKVQEKVVNLLDVAVNGGELSNYTDIALRALVTRKKLTSAELKGIYREATKHGGPKDYTEGTANAQQGQMFQLFPALGIAKSVSRGLIEFNQESVLAAKLVPSA